MSAVSGGVARTGEGASALARALARGEFVVTAEVTPPVATDLTEFVARAAPLARIATAVNVTDGAGAKTHVASLVAAHALAQRGIEPILQVTCRDRNRLALQADLLGAVALGLRNVLVLRGDEPRVGDQPDAKPVFDLGTTQVLAMARDMRERHRLPSGTQIKGVVDLVLGAAETVTDPAPDWQPAGLVAKIEAGADFIQTQFCMDPAVARRYAGRLAELGVGGRVPILVGVAPIPSARSARWMRERLVGTVIPEAIVERLERAADPKAEGKAICIEVIRALAAIPGIAGVHVMAPQFHSALAEVIVAAGVVGRPRAQ